MNDKKLDICTGYIVTGFCKVCCHGVHDMERHLLTEEHRRNVKREANGGFVSYVREPRLRNQPKRVASIGTFPGRLNPCIRLKGTEL